MSPFKISGICLSLLVLSGCGNDPEPEKSLPPLVVDTAERFAPVELKIPGVGGDEVVAEKGDVTVMALPDQSIPTEDAAADKPAGPVTSVDIPRPLLLSEVVHTRFSNLLQGTSELPIIDAVFYPLGWSKDGKFAYAIEPPDEAVGSYFLNVYVQDLVTDKVLWQDKYQSPAESDAGFRSFAAYWMAKESDIKARLNKYGIELMQEGVLFAGPINYKDDQIKYQVQKKLKAQPNFGNVAMVSEYQIEVASTTRGKKSVHKETYKAPLSVLDVDVIGYLRGDDPERVAILVGGVKRGWEGPPHVTWFKVIGTNLRRGFKK